MEKPVIQIVNYVYWDYNDVMNYLVKTNKINERLKRKFWHWLIDWAGINNGGFFTLEFEYLTPEYLTSVSELDIEDYVEVLDVLKTEFSPDGQPMKFLTEW